MTDEYDNSTENTLDNQGPNINYHDHSQDVNKSPDARFQDPEITYNLMRVKVILTPREVDQFSKEWHFPSTREGVKMVNGKATEVIEELYRIDPIGRIVTNDDVVGISWKTNVLIPHDLLGICPGWFGVHRTQRNICLTVDGERELDEFFCDACLEVLETYLNWNKWTLGLFKIPL